MRSWLIITVCLGLTHFSYAGTILTNAPTHIELPDQYEQVQKLSFPNTNVTLLTIADRKGSEQIADWVAPVKQQFGNRVDVRGIADVSAVPRLLRGMVRSSFRKQQSYPVMMDWSGEVVRKFTPTADCVNVFLIDGHGKILQRYEGAAQPARIKELCRLLEQHLPAETKTKFAAKP